MNWHEVSKFLELRDGGVYWRKTKGKAKAGTLFGSDNGSGYFQGKIFGVRMYAHRMAWFLRHKEMPTGEIDHINGISTDNRIENLRVVNRVTNATNIKSVRSDNKLGVMGVQKHRDKFRTRIRIGNKIIRMGGFPTPELAHEAYMNLKRSLHAGYVEVTA